GVRTFLKNMRPREAAMKNRTTVRKRIAEVVQDQGSGFDPHPLFVRKRSVSEADIQPRTRPARFASDSSANVTERRLKELGLNGRRPRHLLRSVPSYFHFG